MLIVAMLAQTTTAVPAQRLLFPQHWLLAGWDMVGAQCPWKYALGGCPRVAIDEKGLPTIQYVRLGCRHSTPQHQIGARAQDYLQATPQNHELLVSYRPLATKTPRQLPRVQAYGHTAGS